MPRIADTKREPRTVTDAQVNMRSNDHAVLVLDGEDFPFHIDKTHGVKVQVNDNNVHLVIVAIQVDRSVNVMDHTPNL